MLCLLAVGPAYSQVIHTASGPSPRTSVAQGNGQGLTVSTEPLACEQYKFTVPHWYVYCRGVESELVQSSAKRGGQPVPSRRIVDLPASGTPDATGLGLACISGSAMRRLHNGWEQLRDGSGNWLRCRVK